MKKTIHIEAKAEVLSYLLEEVETWVDQQELSPAVANAVVLTVEELAANIIHHAEKNDRIIQIILTMDIVGNKIQLIIKDNAAPFNPLSVPLPDTTTDAEGRPIGGLGIFIVKQLMNEITYAYSGKQNILTLTRER